METNITKINVGGTLLPVNDPNVCDNFEDGNTASKTYNAGEFLIWKGSLYKVTTTIAQGATFTDGVNLEDATITELLEAVNTALSNLNNSITPSSVTVTALTDVSFNGSRFYKTGRIVNLNSLVKYANNIASGQGFQTFANLGDNLPTSQVFFPISTYSGNIGTGTIKSDGTLQFDFPNGYTGNDDVVMNVTYIN